MKTWTAQNGIVVDSPEKGDAQRIDYRGYSIQWMSPPIPSYCNCDWSAARDGYEEEGGFHSSSIQGLKDQIDEHLEEENASI